MQKFRHGSFDKDQDTLIEQSMLQINENIFTQNLTKIKQLTVCIMYIHINESMYLHAKAYMCLHTSCFPFFINILLMLDICIYACM